MSWLRRALSRPLSRAAQHRTARSAEHNQPLVPIAVGCVSFGDLRRLGPISPLYGYDRGRPIDRYYIEAFLRTHAADIRGRVLEVEDDAYTRTFGGNRVCHCDVLHVSPDHSRATIIADLTHAPHIPSDSYDCIILTQTLQYIYDTPAALATLYRILKPGGVLLATFPGLSRTSDPLWSDRWYWNFTSRSARRLFADVFPEERLDVRGYGNVLVATAFLYGLAVAELRQDELEYSDPGFEIVITARAVRP
jgi:SAM-dependent methyltransferase